MLCSTLSLPFSPQENTHYLVYPSVDNYIKEGSMKEVLPNMLSSRVNTFRCMYVCSFVVRMSTIFPASLDENEKSRYQISNLKYQNSEEFLKFSKFSKICLSGPKFSILQKKIKKHEFPKENPFRFINIFSELIFYFPFLELIFVKIPRIRTFQDKLHSIFLTHVVKTFV